MNTETYKTLKCGTDNNEEIVLQYILLSKESFEEPRSDKTIYGIKLNKIMGDITETETIHGISEDKKIVTSMIEKIASGHVTPITLVNVVDDMLD